MRRFVLFFLFSSLFADICDNRSSFNALIYDLEIARYFDAKLEESLPANYNHLLSTGCFTTPSARMTKEGEISFGLAEVPPYLHWNFRIEPLSHLELSANYRIFHGVEDAGLSPHGFGDFAERGANFKWALVTPEDSDNTFPGIAVGIEDFMGTRAFTNYFVVGTQVWPEFGLETSLGWGEGRYSNGPSHGFFGSIVWFPWWKCDSKWIKGFSLSAEYDPIDYKNPSREPHPDGRVSHLPINYGAKYKFGNILDLSASRIRGDAFAYAGALSFNWGETKGFLPKIKDPSPYKSPICQEPLGCSRSERELVRQLHEAFKDQGFCITKICLEEKRLWIVLVNERYREEHIFRMRIENLLAFLTPENICEVVVIVESYGTPCQQYIYPRELLLRYAAHRISPYEFDILTPREEAMSSPSFPLYYHRLDPWRGNISPRLETFFGSSSGKFKYDFGLRANLEGFLFCALFYELQLSYTLLADLQKVTDFDRYNPSQLPNVLTDYVRYRQEGNFSTDKAYVQKSYNFGRGLFGRLSGGYFQANYGGVAGEMLWYPAGSFFALGLDGAVLKKRSYTGLGFQSKLRQLDGLTPTFRPYTTLEQYFLSLYLDFPEISIAAKASVGQFLARDKGGRFEITRYFSSGLRLTAWLTITDAEDILNGETYFNRGFAIELPLDLFYCHSSRRVWNYGMAAWLRDAGAFTSTGINLFDIINRERRW